MHSATFPTTLTRLVPKKVIKPVIFLCMAPHARQVYLVGDFNNWEPTSLPMVRQPDGGWRLEVHMGHGHHQYLFSVDGVHTLDPHAQGVARNKKGERVSLVPVS